MPFAVWREGWNGVVAGSAARLSLVKFDRPAAELKSGEDCGYGGFADPCPARLGFELWKVSAETVFTQSGLRCRDAGTAN
jgi:hypothetical protein